MDQHAKDNLYKALGLFIEDIRAYVVELLRKHAGDKWSQWFMESLSHQQLAAWQQARLNGSAPEALIDFHHLRGFALKYKDLLKEDFGKKVNDLPTWLNAIADVRHKAAHFQAIEDDDAQKCYLHMRDIAKALKHDELFDDLKALQASTPAAVARDTNEAQPWFRVVQPHLDIRQGRLDESVFAANLAEVALNTGREVYKNSTVFFQKTYFTAGLRNVARRVVQGLNGQEDAENRVISLQTGFGGGKTHSLISLYHIAKSGSRLAQIEHAKELLSQTGPPKFEEANVAVFTNTTNDPVNGRKVAEGITIRTIWGEIAWQLGGAEAYAIVRKNDEQRVAPAGLFKQVLARCTPALILVDELADYTVKAMGVPVGNGSLADQTISFMQELTEAVSGTDRAVLVATLPASVEEVGNTPEAQSVLSSLQRRVSRVGNDMLPVADDEIFEVIRRRLFDEPGDAAVISRTITAYTNEYQKLWNELPEHAARVDYAERMLKAYPFHPELVDVFRVRWASSHEFQRTRGVLRLLAAIISDLWKRQHTLTGKQLLIQSSDVELGSVPALAGQLKKLFGNGFDAVISADVSGPTSNAFRIDGNKPEFGQWKLAEGIASTILLNTFGTDGAQKGIDVKGIKLSVLKPDSFNHNSVNGALDDLEGNAHYLHYAQTGRHGKRYWFHTKPNINILVEQAKGAITEEEVFSEILRRLQTKGAAVRSFEVLIAPTADIPERNRLTLLVMHPKHAVANESLNGEAKKLIEKHATKKGNSERTFRNMMLFLLPTELGMGTLRSKVREYLACTRVRTDYQGQLEADQKTDLSKRIEDSGRACEQGLVSAYSLLVKHVVRTGPSVLPIKNFKSELDRQIEETIVPLMKEEEWLLDGLGVTALKSNGLYPDPDRDLRVKDVHEAFLRFDDKPMISGPDVVRASLLKYCAHGEFAIAYGQAPPFSKYYYRGEVPFFDVQSTDFWVVDKSKVPPPEPVPTPIHGIQSPAAGEPAPATPPAPGVAGPASSGVKEVRQVTISGKVPLEQYQQLFMSFVKPLAKHGIEIEVKISARSMPNNPLTQSSPEYKVAKESARQLGLEFGEE
jgi:hypothetical protein